MKSMRKSRDVTVRVYCEDGSFWATVDEFPGVFAAGDTEQEVFESVIEGIEAYLTEGDRKPQVQLVDVTPHEPSPAVRTVKKTLVSA